MKKGNYGIALSFYAAAAMALAIIGWELALMLLIGFVIVAERDDWTTKNCLKAITTLVLKDLIVIVLSILSKPINWINSFVSYGEDTEAFHGFVNGFNSIVGIVCDVVGVAAIVFLVLAILSVMKEKEAKIPLVDIVVDFAYGFVLAKIPVATVANSKKCPNCGAPVVDKFCDKCGTKIEE